MLDQREEIPISPSKDRSHPCPECGCRLFSEQWPGERRYFHIAFGQETSEAVLVMSEQEFQGHHYFSWLERVGNWMKSIHEYEGRTRDASFQ